MVKIFIFSHSENAYVSGFVNGGITFDASPNNAIGHDDFNDARETMGYCKEAVPNGDFDLFRYYACRGCNTFEYVSERVDAYNIFTGHYCETCYDDSSKYPYRKDRYDYASYGERLDDDY
jgi:hypothetical protein